MFQVTFLKLILLGKAKCNKVISEFSFVMELNKTLRFWIESQNDYNHRGALERART